MTTKTILEIVTYHNVNVFALVNHLYEKTMSVILVIIFVPQDFYKNRFGETILIEGSESIRTQVNSYSFWSIRTQNVGQFVLIWSIRTHVWSVRTHFGQFVLIWSIRTHVRSIRTHFGQFVIKLK